MLKESELWLVCGNIVWGQRVSWIPQCAARHLHSLRNSYQEFDTALNSDISITLNEASVLACGHLCWCAEWGRAFQVHGRTLVCVARECVTPCAVLWPVVIWRSVLMWTLPVGVDLPSPALWSPASTQLTPSQSEGEVSVYLVCSGHGQLFTACGMHLNTSNGHSFLLIVATLSFK